MIYISFLFRFDSMTTNPTLRANILNTLLIPKPLYNKSVDRQNQLLLGNTNGLRSSLINFYYFLQFASGKPLASLTAYKVLTNQGKVFYLSGGQQYTLFRYIQANRSVGLANLIFRAMNFQKCVNRARSRAVRQP
jgi:hypothetical protein